MEPEKTYAEIFDAVICDEAEKDKRIVLVADEFRGNTGPECFRSRFPDRFFAAGEAFSAEHTVTFAAGLASKGMRPVAALHAARVQRFASRIMYEVCRHRLPVLFAVDRAGLSECGAETGQGIYDLAYLSVIPDMYIMEPKNRWELEDMLRFAVRMDAPAAIRYPEGAACMDMEEFRSPIAAGKCEIMYDEQDIALLCAGSMVQTGMEVRRALRDLGYGCSLINMRFVKPLDEQAVIQAAADHSLLVTMEENVRTGGMGDAVLECLADIGSGVPVLNAALPDEYVEAGTAGQMRKEAGIDADTIIRRIVTRYIGLYPA